MSFEKSNLHCSPNTKKRTVRKIVKICGSPSTDNLGKYLGMPLIHSRINKYTYANIVDKVQNRLSGWKSKSLSMAGRLTLIQAVTSSSPIYAMQTARLPASSCSKIDKLNRNFLWGDTDQRKKIHLIKWDTVCKPKLQGGLGIKRIAAMNQAMLAKTSWRMLQNDKGLWHEIYKAKYLRRASFLDPNYTCPNSSSSTWRSIIFGAKLLNQGLQWRVGKGDSISFWTDCWLPTGALI